MIGRRGESGAFPSLRPNAQTWGTCVRGALYQPFPILLHPLDPTGDSRRRGRIRRGGGGGQSFLAPLAATSLRRWPPLPCAGGAAALQRRLLLPRAGGRCYLAPATASSRRRPLPRASSSFLAPVDISSLSATSPRCPTTCSCLQRNWARLRLHPV
jgi:hypothetical protein